MNNSMKAAWEADMARVDAQMQPYIGNSEGWLYISDECPEPLSDIYAKLVQVGYANGYID